MELWRRLILLVFICSAIWLATFASLAPLVLVEPVDFAEKQSKEGSYMGFRVMADEKQRLADMPLHKYIAEITGNRLLKTEGRDWEELFENVMAVKEGKAVAKEWARRLPSDQYPMKVLFFRSDEPPISALPSDFRNANDAAYVSRTKGDRTEYLELKYRRYSDNDFHFGSGLTTYPHPPSYLFFPYRTFSLWLALAGLIIYVVLPRAKPDPRAMHYPLWRMVLGDIAAFIFIVPFFSFPLLITGGSMQAFTAGWPFLLIFWPFSLLGAGVLTISAWFASYQILLLEDRMRISTYKGRKDFLYGDMALFQPVTFKPPSWLIFMSWAAALSGRGRAAIGATGRAMLLSSSESSSIGITLRNGKAFYISITDQMGSPMLKGSDGIIDTLKHAGVEEKTEVKEIRSLGFETLRIPD